MGKIRATRVNTKGRKVKAKRINATIKLKVGDELDAYEINDIERTCSVRGCHRLATHDAINCEKKGTRCERITCRSMSCKGETAGCSCNIHEWGNVTKPYEVSKILAEYREKEVTRYLIQWKNWDGDNTWEPEENLTCTAALAEYHRRRRGGTHAAKKRNNYMELVESIQVGDLITLKEGLAEVTSVILGPRGIELDSRYGGITKRIEAWKEGTIQHVGEKEETATQRKKLRSDLNELTLTQLTEVAQSEIIRVKRRHKKNYVEAIMQRWEEMEAEEEWEELITTEWCPRQMEEEPNNKESGREDTATLDTNERVWRGAARIPGEGYARLQIEECEQGWKHTLDFGQGEGRWRNHEEAQLSLRIDGRVTELQDEDTRYLGIWDHTRNTLQGEVRQKGYDQEKGKFSVQSGVQWEQLRGNDTTRQIVAEAKRTLQENWDAKHAMTEQEVWIELQEMDSQELRDCLTQHDMIAQPKSTDLESREKIMKRWIRERDERMWRQELAEKSLDDMIRIAPECRTMTIENARRHLARKQEDEHDEEEEETCVEEERIWIVSDSLKRQRIEAKKEQSARNLETSHRSATAGAVAERTTALRQHENSGNKSPLGNGRSRSSGQRHTVTKHGL
jgi:hypothetical protein